MMMINQRVWQTNAISDQFGPEWSSVNFSEIKAGR